MSPRHDFCSEEEILTGFKWTLKTLGAYLNKQGIEWSEIWRQIEDTCIKTVLLGHEGMHKGVQGLRSGWRKTIMFILLFYFRSSYSCYKLLGLDIMLDSKLKPWVLEVGIKKC